MIAAAGKVRLIVVAVSVLLGALGLIGIDLIASPLLDPCGGEERKIFAEFPQYGGAKMETEPNPDANSCAVYYQIPDSPEQVFAYFSKELRARGWAVKAAEAYPGASVEERSAGPRTIGGTLLTATRDGFYYEVSYESLEFHERARPGVHLAVHVGER